MFRGAMVMVDVAHEVDGSWVGHGTLAAVFIRDRGAT